MRFESDERYERWDDDDEDDDDDEHHHHDAGKMAKNKWCSTSNGEDNCMRQALALEHVTNYMEANSSTYR